MGKLEDLAKLIDKRSHYECWEWLGQKDKLGQGIIYDYPAHVLVWEMFFGDVPVGSTLVHNCGSINCVNPYHLDLLEYKGSAKYVLTLPNDFRELSPGTYEWKQFWKKHPEQQEEMLEWKGEAK